MLDPRLLCSVHLRGEHYEIHKAIGNLRHSGHWAWGLARRNFLELHNLKRRHDRLAKEMIRRGMNHRSPVRRIRKAWRGGEVDRAQSVRDLIKRCPDCRANLRAHARQRVA